MQHVCTGLGLVGVVPALPAGLFLQACAALSKFLPRALGERCALHNAVIVKRCFAHAVIV
jgi:hypothetical protein